MSEPLFRSTLRFMQLSLSIWAFHAPIFSGEIMVEKQDLHLRHSAYHECGHAAVALHLECLVREVYIYDQRCRYEGDTKFDISRTESREKADLKACVVGLSGIAAALKHDPSRDPRARGDEERVSGILQRFPAADRAARYKECQAQASELVSLLWPQIGELANALETKSPDPDGRRSLSQKEVEEIYASTRRYDDSTSLPENIV